MAEVDGLVAAVGAECTVEIMEGMMRAAGEALVHHGNDPNSAAILLAAYLLAIETINDKIDPTFKDNLIKVLQSER